MDYAAPSGSTDTGAPFVGKTASTQGSKVPPRAVEFPQREIVHAIKGMGLTPSNGDLTQLLQLVAFAAIPLGVFGGTANALTATMPGSNPPPPAAGITADPVIIPVLKPGMRVKGIAAYANTSGTPKVTLTGIGSAGGSVQLPIVGPDGVSAIPVPAWAPGQFLTFDIDASGNARFGGAGSGSAVSGVTVVTNQTLYVRTDGNDANDGSANDAGHAFATLTAAISASFRYVTTGNPVVIRLGLAGAYAAPGRINLSGRSIQILGDTANQGSYIISGAGASDGTALVQPTNGFLSLTGVTLQNTGNPSSSAIAGLHGALFVSYVTFQTTVSNPHYHLATDGGSLLIGPGCIFASSMGGWLECRGGYGQIDSTGTLTFQGTPAWSIAGIVVADTGVVGLTRTYAPTISGSATGVRFSANNNGVIETWGSGVNLYPGNSAGTTSTGGVYA